MEEDEEDVDDESEEEEEEQEEDEEDVLEDDGNNSGFYLTAFGNQQLNNIPESGGFLLRFKLTEFKLKIQCRIDDVADAIKNNKHYSRALIVRELYMTVEGLAYLSNVLSNDTMFTSLTLQFCGTTHIGPQSYLSDIVTANRTITKLNIEGCPLRSDTMRPFFDALCTNTAITTLTMDNNSLDGIGYCGLAKCLAMNATMRELTVGMQSLAHEDVTAIIKALGINTALRTFDMSAIKLRMDHVKELAKTVRRNTTLCHLFMRNFLLVPTIGEEMDFIYRSALSDNKNICTIQKVNTRRTPLQHSLLVNQTRAKSHVLVTPDDVSYYTKNGIPEDTTRVELIGLDSEDIDRTLSSISAKGAAASSDRYNLRDRKKKT